MTTELIETASKLIDTESQQSVEAPTPAARTADEVDRETTLVIEIALKLELVIAPKNGRASPAGALLVRVSAT